MKYLVDTNLLIDFPEVIMKYDCVLLSHVLRELEYHKRNIDKDTAARARKATRYLSVVENVQYDIKDYQVRFDEYDKQYADNKILQCALDNGYGIITFDLLLREKAKVHNVPILTEFDKPDDNYSGYIEVKMSDNEIADFYQELSENKYNILPNQYIIIRNKKGELVDTCKWDGQEIKLAHQKGFKTQQFGVFKPLDEYQICAIDSLHTNQMTMIKGKAGSGKSMIALNYAWSQIEKGKYDKLIIFTNPVASKNSARLGFYPGTRDEKLLNSQTGTMLAGKFGDLFEVQKQITQGRLMLMPFADIRGFDTTGMNAIIWFIESQNLDIELMKLGISRIGNDCKIILDGDYSGQVDMDAYAGLSNGMRRVSEVFRGKDFYGEVELVKVHRSKMAAVADLL